MATATETFEHMKSKAGDAAASATDKAKQAASSVADKAKQAASSMGQKAEDATHAVGSGFKSLGETIRDKGPREGVLGTATSSVAEGLENTGQYLQQHGLGGIAKDMTNLIRNNPIPALLVGVGLGFILARATMRS